MLNINKTTEEGKTTMALVGRLDTTTAPELENAIREILPDAKELELDFTELEYISSAGLRVLLSTEKAIKGQGVFKLTHVRETVMEILEVTGFTEILNIE